ncbi:acid-sensing ion channel 2-like [Galendromus occidentalis]|uniref:Acid-sensing ion channel 2-like n=1 Tax=Galendromus occidentalis TaxID=34638 RepID=A0AAJ7PA68_9ACAR|nr:acid-sensing ion channel 2-like [Galendromus occidentalis]
MSGVMKSDLRMISCGAAPRESYSESHRWNYRYKQAVHLTVLVTLFVCSVGLIRRLLLTVYKPDVVDTSVSEVSNYRLHFPAVTICNQNPFRKSRICEDDTFRPLCNIARGDDRLFVEEFIRILRNYELDLRALENVTYAPDELIISCHIDGKRCHGSWYRRVTPALPRLGICYCLFCGMDINRIPEAESEDLVLQLRSEFDDYLPHTSDKGFVVMLHDPADFPSVNKDGVYVSPGVVSNIGISVTKLEQTESLAESCSDEWPQSVFSIVDYLDLIAYSPELCTKLCTNVAIIDKCNCTEVEDLDDGSLHFQLLLDTEGICADENNTKAASACHKEALVDSAGFSRDHKTERNCECPSKCEQTMYKKTLSSADLAPSRTLTDAELEAILEAIERETDGVLRTASPGEIEDEFPKGTRTGVLADILLGRNSATHAEDHSTIILLPLLTLIPLLMIRFAKAFSRVRIYFSSMSTTVLKQSRKINGRVLQELFGSYFSTFLGVSAFSALYWLIDHTSGICCVSAWLDRFAQRLSLKSRRAVG